MKNKALKTALIITGVFAAGAALLLKSDSAAKGASQALTICLNVIIPSLFPFLVLSTFIVRLDLKSKKNGIVNSLMCKLFSLPGEALPAVLLGLTAGYPTGVKTTEQLYKNGVLTKNEAIRLCMFAVNSGVAFCVGTAGGMFFGNTKIGLILFFSSISANVITGMVTKLFATPEIRDAALFDEARSVSTGACEALVDSVETAVHNTFSLCGWTVIFSTFVQILTDLFPYKIFSNILVCLAEVTAAVSFSAGHGSIVLAAFCLGFGGLSVHFQLLPSLRTIGVNYLSFFLARAAAGILCAVFSYINVKIFDIALPVNTGSFTCGGMSVSAPAAFALIFMCCVFILNLANDKKRCYNTKKHREK